VRRPANLRAFAAAAATTLALAGCGGGERQDADAAEGTYTVDVVRAEFPARQRLAQAVAFVMTVRNAGEKTIPNLAVTLRGFTARQAGNDEADPGRPLWVIDDQPPVTASADTWTAGALEAGEETTLRWRVTSVVAGTHALRYSIAPSLQGDASLELAGGGAARGALTVRINAKPAFARVDPGTGRVVRDRDE